MTEELADRRCPNGHPVRPGARFCPVCGTEVADLDEDTYDRESPPPGQPPRHGGRWATVIGVFVVVAALAVGATVLRSNRQDRSEPGAQIPTDEQVTLLPPSAWPTTTTGPPTPLPSRTATATGQAPPPRPVPPPPSPPPYTPRDPNPPQDPHTYDSPRMVGIVDYTAADDSRAHDVARTLDSYFSGINTGNYERTRAVIDPQSSLNPDDATDWATFVEGVSTSSDSDIVLLDVADDPSGQGSVVARVTFRSSQDAGYGPRGSEEQTCTLWDVQYTLSEPEPGQFLVLSTNGRHRQC